MKISDIIKPDAHIFTFQLSQTQYGFAHPIVNIREKYPTDDGGIYLSMTYSSVLDKFDVTGQITAFAKDETNLHKSVYAVKPCVETVSIFNIDTASLLLRKIYQAYDKAVRKTPDLTYGQIVVLTAKALGINDIWILKTGESESYQNPDSYYKYSCKEGAQAIDGMIRKHYPHITEPCDMG